MKKTGLLLFLLIITLTLQAQVDLQTIKKEVLDKTSAFYYPTLLKRFQASDTTLRLDDFRYIYYGFIFQKNYDPSSIDRLEVKIKDLNQIGDYINAYEIADTILKKYPVSIGTYFEKSYACTNLKRSDEELYNRKRYLVLIKTILSNGTGRSTSEAYTVLSYNDMYEVCDYLGLNIKEEKIVEMNNQQYYLLIPSKNKQKLKALYFYITESFVTPK
jgi:hypothetical protein